MKTTLTQKLQIVLLVCPFISSFAPSAEGSQEEARGKTYQCRLIQSNSKETVGGVQVLLWISQPNENDRSGRVIRVNEKGQFQAELPPGGMVRAELYPQVLRRGRRGDEPSARVPDTPSTFDVPIDVPVRKILEGRVLKLDGTPVADASVMATEASVVNSSADGRFSLPDYTGAATQLYARSKNGELAGIVAIPATGPAEVRVEPTINLPITVKGDDGKPVHQFTPVNLMLKVNESQTWVNTFSGIALDGMGQGTLGGLCRGARYSLNWYYGDAESFEPGDLEFAAEPGHPLAITVKRFNDDWQARGNVCVSDKTRCDRLSNYCLDGSDNILACDEGKSRVLVVSPSDELLGTWPLPFQPQAILHRPDGTSVVAGPGRTALLDKNGRVLLSHDVPGRSSSGLGSSGEDIFLACRERSSYAIYRLDAQLDHPTLLVKGLRGCCGQFDITARDGVIYAAANCDFAVIKYDRDGKELGRLGQRNQFNGCCEPKNVCFDVKGNLFAAESDDCCIKQIKADGKQVVEIGKVGNIHGCVRVTIAVSQDGKRFYMLDTRRNIVRLMTPKA